MYLTERSKVILEDFTEVYRIVNIFANNAEQVSNYRGPAEGWHRS